MLGSTRNLILPAATLPGMPGRVVEDRMREPRKGEGEKGLVMTGVEARGVARVEAEGAS
jgi:hypothetical protein